MKRQILITVGTTKFENLIKSIDNKLFYQLIDKYFTHMIIQIGSGEYKPILYKDLDLKLNICVGTLFKNFEEIIKESDYVISHAGAGIILESLKNKKKLIVVVNDLLMDNHQIELAEALEKDEFAYYIREIENILDVLKSILDSNKELKPYPDFNLEVIPNIIYEMLDI